MQIRCMAACLILSAASVHATDALPIGPPAHVPTAPPKALAQALRAAVTIESRLGSDAPRTASGVILQIRDGVAYIATARHVVDRAFASTRRPEPPAPDSLQGISIRTFDHVQAAAKVEWIAPHAIDVAILSAPLSNAGVEAARWDRDAAPQVGAALFSIGNPHGIGSAQATGTLVQIRDYERNDYAFQMLQANLRLQPGDSGGGLFDADGQLIGINSMGLAGGDPRFPTGVGLSTALRPLLDLAPERLRLPPSNPGRS